MYIFPSRSLLWLFFVVLFVRPLSAQNIPPKREFRAAWIATVKNVDWPSKAGLSTAEQQSELIELLDLCKKNRLNAVIFQVRPACDAFYDSPFEPWSEWLTGKQGQAPEPFYDPLAFAIEQCHLRGMELHAWFNPYRAMRDTATDIFRSEKHISQRYPDWILTYGATAYLDPGMPEARAYATDVIMDVVRRYDIDGVHFDDYFYPYRIPEVDFPDSTSYELHANWINKEDWRRANVDTFVQHIYESIKAVRPDVEFGVSPFGVWRNFEKDPLGSATRAGQTCYDDLFADVRKWVIKGWMDYVAPQMYWSIGYPPADYSELVDWWSRTIFGMPVYVGQGLYKVNNNHDSNWEMPTQIGDQIELLRNYREMKGSIFFSAKHFRKNPLGVLDSLQNKWYAYPALPPVTLTEVEPPIAMNAPRARSVKGGISLEWEKAQLPEGAEFLLVYRFPKKEMGSLEDPTHIKEIIGIDKGRWLDEDTRFLKRYSYVFRVVDQFGQEGKPTEPVRKQRWTGLFGGKKNK